MTSSGMLIMYVCFSPFSGSLRWRRSTRMIYCQRGNPTAALLISDANQSIRVPEFKREPPRGEPSFLPVEVVRVDLSTNGGVLLLCSILGLTSGIHKVTLVLGSWIEFDNGNLSDSKTGFIIAGSF